MKGYTKGGRNNLTVAGKCLKKSCFGAHIYTQYLTKEHKNMHKLLFMLLYYMFLETFNFGDNYIITSVPLFPFLFPFPTYPPCSLKFMVYFSSIIVTCIFLVLYTHITLVTCMLSGLTIKYLVFDNQLVCSFLDKNLFPPSQV